jgi:hypothetical protein
VVGEVSDEIPAATGLGAIRGDKTKATEALDVILRQHGHRDESGARSENRLPGRQPEGTPRLREGGGRSEPADFMITKEKYAHRRFFFRDHAERRG